MTTLVQIQSEINSTNLVDGDQLKKLLLDVVAFVTSSAAAPAATTTTIGSVKEAADVAALTSVGPGTAAGTVVDVGAAFSQVTLNANFASIATQLNAALAAFKTAGQMA